MPRALLTLRDASDRAKAERWVRIAPVGTRVEFKKPQRSIPQNDMMWACLTDVATQVTWHGLRLTPDDWKLIFLDALNRELRMVPNIDGNGFVNLSKSSSDLSKSEMTDMIELIRAFGANHDVKFQDREEAA
ncbi:NinB protein [Afipia felis]|uniref:NinB protein n=1 Tax=Afipia felis TaxID=1035 RepID=A0A090MT18_AFIFE|nr:recombination protein NinB [Afipia felis]CEG08754.1 NinB protein [Afipia felis]